MTAVTGRRGPFFGTYGPAGRLARAWPLDPRPEDLHVCAIARGLSCESRFIGATRGFWPVASHCVECSLAPMSTGEPAAPLLQFKRLMHEGAEPILRDFPGPLKHAPEMGFAEYCRVEHEIMLVVADRFKLQRGFHKEPEVKWADTLVFRTEVRDLRQPHDWDDARLDGPTLPHRLWPTSPAAAERRWLRRFAELADQLGLHEDTKAAREALAAAEKEHRSFIRIPAVEETGMACIFCERQQSEVTYMIAGPGHYICAECVGLAADILKEAQEMGQWSI